MALVPCPALSASPGAEVGTTQVHDAGGEAQQTAVSVGPVHPGSRGRQAVLLVGAGQQVEGAVLEVGGLLDELRVQDEVRGGCRGGQDSGITSRSLRKKCKHGHVFAGFGSTHSRHM